MIPVDTNVLIYAHRVESEWHQTAARLITLGEGVERWALPVFCVTEFMRVVTHRRLFNPPSTVAQAANFVEAVVASPICEVVQPGTGLPTVSTGAVGHPLSFLAQDLPDIVERTVRVVQLCGTGARLEEAPDAS